MVQAGHFHGAPHGAVVADDPHGHPVGDAPEVQVRENGKARGAEERHLTQVDQQFRMCAGGSHALAGAFERLLQHRGGDDVDFPDDTDSRCVSGVL
jgi:Cu/Zn superoxide dismutase